MRNILWVVVLVMLLTFAVGTGIYGVDFGYHWDEPRQFRSVNWSLDEGNIKDLDLRIPPELFYVRARSVFVFVTCLGGLWVFLAVRALKGPLAGLVGAATYLLSWEFAYHARWIAPDAVMAQFCALFLLGVVMSEVSKHRRQWLVFSVIAAGLATATKYPGGMLLFALMLLIVLRLRGQPLDPRAALRQMGPLFAYFAIAFLVITPGSLIQPVDFFLDVWFQVDYYQTGHSISADIHGFFTYASRIIEYLSLAMLSRNEAISLLLLALAGVGFFALWKTEKNLAIVLGAIPAFTVFYFSTQIVFVARNFLFILPILSILVGIGAGHLFHARLRKEVRATLGAVLLVAFGLNAYWLYQDSRAIHDFDELMLPQEAEAYIRSRPDTSFLLSQGVRSAIVGMDVVLPQNSLTNGETADYVLFYHSELIAVYRRILKWPGTKHDTFRWFGTNEVNFNYYPTWNWHGIGRDRIIFMPIDQAREYGIPFFTPESQDSTS
jgi:hypothetical protein